MPLHHCAKVYNYNYVRVLELHVFIVPLKFLTVVCSSLLDHVDKVICQDKRHALPVDPEFPLEVAQEVPKINVEQLKSKVSL